MSKSISQILHLKGRDVWSIAPDTTTYDALQLMAKKSVGALVVLDNDRVIGIFSERDHVRKVDLLGHRSKETAVRDVMTDDIYCVNPTTSVEEAMTIVTNSRTRYLPVMEEDHLVGLASIGDLVKALLDEKEYEIKQLMKHIKGRS